MWTLGFNLQNSLYNCFRCGAAGHLYKFMDLINGERVMDNAFDTAESGQKPVERLSLSTLHDRVDNLKHELYPAVNAYLTGKGEADRHLS